MKLEAILPHKSTVLESFTPSEREIILQRIKVLTPLCRMVSGDLDMEVEVNEDKGWHWDFDKNIVRCDAKDLLEKPMDFLRFVIQHEAGHRKISRVIDVIPNEVWRQPGYSFMTNVIEDPRMNNYVADSVPKFRQEMLFSYNLDLDFEAEIKKKAKKNLGDTPRFMQAGFEYIKHWVAECKGEKKEIDKSLPKEVQEVLRKTLPSAQKSWLTYPSKEDANKGMYIDDNFLNPEEAVTAYAKASFEINFSEVWPLFKTLVDEDIEDAKEDLKNKSKKGDSKKTGEKSEADKSKQKSETSPDEKSDVGNPSDEKKELTDEEAEAIVKELIKELEKELAEHFQAKEDTQNSDSKKDDKAKGKKTSQVGTRRSSDSIPQDSELDEATLENERKVKEAMEKARKDFEDKLRTQRSDYDKTLIQVAPIISNLEDELREIFIERKRSLKQSGFKSGNSIDIQREIKSEASGAPDLKVFERRDFPLEQDYVIEILVDLSGSMRGEKIEETYKAVVVLCEALKNIGIKLSVTGFHDQLISYKDFDSEYNDEHRKGTESMGKEVFSPGARYNDDGWAVQEVVSRIKKRPEQRKIVFILSDGLPVPSPERQGYDLGKIVKEIEEEKDVHIVGLGIGPGTEHVKNYYRDNIANVNIHEFAKQLAKKVKEVIGQ